MIVFALFDVVCHVVKIMPFLGVVPCPFGGCWKGLINDVDCLKDYLCSMKMRLNGLITLLGDTLYC